MTNYAANSGAARLMGEGDLRDVENLAMRTGLVVDVAAVFLAHRVAASRCARCGISNEVSGIEIDRDGICTECRRFGRYKERLSLYFSTRADLHSIVEESRTHRRSEVDCMLLFSGGKDSTYALYQLVNMGLKVMTFTFDNGFISRQAFQNIERITSALGIEHMTASHGEMNNVFRESLARHSTVCKGCFKALLDLSLTLADERGINLIFTGMSRGQIVDERLKFFYDRNIFSPTAIDEKLAAGRRVYHRVERYTGLDGRAFEDDGLFDRVRLIDYFRYDDAAKDEIYRYLRETGWEEPGDTGFCSTNCLINDVGITVHRVEKGYSNYEVPTAWEVRLGHLGREAAVAELSGDVDAVRTAGILSALDYAPSPRGEPKAVIQLFTVLKQGSDLLGLEKTMNHTWPYPDAQLRFVRTNAIARDGAGQVLLDALKPEIQSVGAEVPAPSRAAGLSLFQRRLFADAGRNAGDWAVCVATVDSVLNPAIFRRALLHALVQFPVLRLKSTALGSHEVGDEDAVPIPAVLPLNWADLASKSVEERAVLETRLTTALLARASTTPDGPLASFAVIAPNSTLGSSIGLVIHRALMDQTSLRILLNHLDASYQALSRGTAIGLPFPDANVPSDVAPPDWLGVRVKSAGRPVASGFVERCGRASIEVLAREMQAALAPRVAALIVERPAAKDDRIGHFAQCLERRPAEPTLAIVIRRAHEREEARFDVDLSNLEPVAAGGRSWIALAETQHGFDVRWSAASDDADDTFVSSVLLAHFVKAPDRAL